MADLGTVYLSERTSGTAYVDGKSMPVSVPPGSYPIDDYDDSPSALCIIAQGRWVWIKDDGRQLGRRMAERRNV